jgi:hypothetical protein
MSAPHQDGKTCGRLNLTPAIDDDARAPHADRRQELLPRLSPEDCHNPRHCMLSLGSGWGVSIEAKAFRTASIDGRKVSLWVIRDRFSMIAECPLPPKATAGM